MQTNACDLVSEMGLGWGSNVLCNCDHRTWIRLKHSTADPYNRGRSYDTNNWKAHRHTMAYTPQRGTCTSWPPTMYNYVTNTAHLMVLHAWSRSWVGSATEARLPLLAIHNKHPYIKSKRWGHLELQSYLAAVENDKVCKGQCR